MSLSHKLYELNMFVEQGIKGLKYGREVTGIVTDKWSGMDCGEFLIVDGFEIGVFEDDYNETNIGDNVRLYLSDIRFPSAWLVKKI